MFAAFIALFIATVHAQTATTSDMVSHATAPAVMIEIARCESGLRQFRDDGTVLTSPTSDFGYFQINQSNLKLARSLGYDVMTERGNIAFALWLYKHNGVRDWSASSACWKPRIGI